LRVVKLCSIALEGVWDLPAESCETSRVEELRQLDCWLFRLCCLDSSIVTKLLHAALDLINGVSHSEENVVNTNDGVEVAANQGLSDETTHTSQEQNNTLHCQLLVEAYKHLHGSKVDAVDSCELDNVELDRFGGLTVFCLFFLF